MLFGQHLAEGGVPPHADWIRTYSSPEFGQLAQQLEILLIGTLAPRRQYIRSIAMPCCVNEIFSGRMDKWIN